MCIDVWSSHSDYSDDIDYQHIMEIERGELEENEDRDRHCLCTGGCYDCLGLSIRDFM